MEEIKRALKNSKIFKDLPDDAIDYLSNYINLREFKKGRIIFFEGDKGKILYIIKSGKVSVIKKDSEGKERIMAILSEGDFIGEMALIEESERSATCKAEEDTELLLFTKRAFDEIMENNPKIACIILREITKVLSRRLRETTEKIV
ncbi:MAG: cyclic nucleotide-binding domain-containing protein [candidate division WOR-3 bacterium]